MKATHQHSATGKLSLLRPCLLMLLVLFCSVPGWGSKQESIKKKEINKSFNVGKNDICKLTTVTETLRLRIGARAKSPSVS